MFCKNKLIVIADNIEDTIQSQVTAYEVLVFKTFTAFEEYVDKVPVTVESVIVSERVMPFTGQNMTRMIHILESSFVELTGEVLYLLSSVTQVGIVESFLHMRNIGNWIVYQGDLSTKYITDIVTGSKREADEEVNEVVTYRIRASDYIKQQERMSEDDNNHYMSDDELLNGIPDVEEPEEVTPTEEHELFVNYVVGKDCVERTLFVFLLAQYFSMRQKVLILERDIEYHTLGELLTKSSIDFEYISIDDFYRDAQETIKRVKCSDKRIIFVGTKNRRKYDYNFVFDMLQSSLREDIDRFIRELSYDETPYGVVYTVVTANTVPELLNCCNSLKYAIDAEMVTFVGVQCGSLGSVNLTSGEMKAIAEVVLMQNGINAQVMKVHGLNLKGGGPAYDILGILNRGNRG